MAETPFGYFPDVDVRWDIKISRSYRTQVTTSKTGKEQRRRMFPGPGSSGTGQRGGYGICTATSDAFKVEDRYPVVSFLDSLEGMWRAFYWWRRDRDKFVNYEVGSVSAQSSIIIPFKESTVTSVTVANVSKGFTVTSNVGPGGEDRINFTAGVQTGAVRIDCIGRERWLVRSQSDEVVEAFLENISIQKSIVALSFKQVR